MGSYKIYRGRALQVALQEVTLPVQVYYVAVDQPEVATMAALADLMALTPHLAVMTQQDPGAPADRVIVQAANGRELVFAGPPLGAELAALFSAIVVAGRGDSGLAAATRQALAHLSKPVHIEVFTTPT